MTSRTLTASRSVMNVTPPFALPVGLSAFLLFAIEPLVGRLVLPIFGGGPMVWAAVLCFFQVLLVAGYAYGHLSVTQFGRWGPLIHLALAGLALYALFQAPSAISASSARSAIDAAWVLAGFIGLPAFVLAATTPLLSSWLEAAGTGREGDPYWLYALANGGSLLALLAYPLLIEPRLGLGAQRLIWTIGFGALALLMARAALRAMPDISRRQPTSWVGLAETRGYVVDLIDWPRRGRWLLLAAVPSGLLSAVTNFIATDLVSAPLLWVIPLAIYLVSLIVAFSPRAGRFIGLSVLLMPALVTLMWIPYGSAGAWPVLAILGLELVGLAVIAIALHGRLAQDRPHAAHLTDFYLTIASGAALGSAFVAILAPTLFPDIWEYPLLLVGALAGLAVVARPSSGASTGRGLTFMPFLAGSSGRVLPYAVGAVLLAALLYLSDSPVLTVGIAWLAIGGLILVVGGRPWFLVLSTAVFLVLAAFVLQPTEFRGRSFFGVTRVLQPADTGLTVLVNGTTVHGSQWIDPAKHRTPTAYYGPGGPAEDIFTVGAERPATGAANVGIVGLGAGELSAYMDVFTVMTYFEIDPVVVRVAQDPALFTYLSDAPGQPRIVVGDARRSLAQEPDGTYGMLVLDAMSSNAVPVHLLTVEAITDELRTVAPDGVIAFHISNRYYDLAPAIAAALEDLGLTALERSGDGGGAGQLPSRWLAASRSGERLGALRALGWEAAVPADHPFTDDYADLLSYLRLGF